MARWSSEITLPPNWGLQPDANVELIKGFNNPLSFSAPFIDKMIAVSEIEFFCEAEVRLRG